MEELKRIKYQKMKEGMSEVEATAHVAYLIEYTKNTRKAIKKEKEQPRTSKSVSNAFKEDFERLKEEK